MKRVLILLFFASNYLIGQETWKERDEFFEVFNPVLQSAIDGNTKPVLEKISELKTRCFSFTSNAREKFGNGDKQKNRNLILLGEQMTLIDIIIKRKQFNAETMYGELAILHNRFRKILLKNEELPISEELLKRYQKEEKNYLAKKKEIYKVNGWY